MFEINQRSGALIKEDCCLTVLPSVIHTIRIFMKFFPVTMLVGALCATGIFNAAHAQTAGANTSPFGKVTAQQKQNAVQAQNAQLSALAAWQSLPAKQQESLTAQMATMSEADRAALLQTVPALKNSTTEEFQLLLADIAQTTPYPVSLKIQPQEVHFLAAGYTSQFTAYMNDVPATVSWMAGTGSNALIIDANGVIRLRPTVRPVSTIGPIVVTATSTDGKNTTATATATAHVMKMAVTDVAQLQASGGTQLSLVATIDDRVPEPNGPPTGGAVFYFKTSLNGNPDHRVALCSAQLVPQAVATPGVRSSGASCVSNVIDAATYLNRTGSIQVMHVGAPGFPQQGIFFGAPGSTTVTP